MSALYRALLLLLITSSSAWALEIAGISVPDVVQGDGSQGRMSLAGHAEVHRRYLPFYGVTLHLPEQRPRSAVLVQGLAPCRITLIWYARDLDAAHVRNYFAERFAGAADDEVLTRARPRIDQLLEVLPGVSRGSRFSFDYDPDRGMRVEIDGEPLISLPGVEFNRVLLSLWLGTAAEDGVARALLAEAS
ncbi:MAG: chalcone isomerase family protein [Xanthomonadales bacterium]|nr:chalcone isomerase family protein [Xanthomonadales bacterium]MCB1635067.1 chalcone isomerase family protein [Xanthomonadales bacterium]